MRIGNSDALLELFCQCGSVADAVMKLLHYDEEAQ